MLFLSLMDFLEVDLSKHKCSWKDWQVQLSEIIIKTYEWFNRKFKKLK